MVSLVNVSCLNSFKFYTKRFPCSSIWVSLAAIHEETRSREHSAIGVEVNWNRRIVFYILPFLYTFLPTIIKKYAMRQFYTLLTVLKYKKVIKYLK